MSRGLKTLSVFASAITYIILLMGALVTNTGSQQGCGASWPLCKGSFLPAFDYNAAIEFSHRAVSGLGGFAVLGLGIWVWFAWVGRPDRNVVRWLAVLANFTLVLQALLGAAAVLWPQPKTVLALHFGISLICFSAVLLLTVVIFRAGPAEGLAGAGVPAQPGPSGLSGGAAAVLEPAFVRWVWYVTAFNYAVVYLGALVRHTGATLACLGWPLCNGQLIPPLFGLTGIAFIHRLAAALDVVLVIRLWVMARRYSAGRREVLAGATLSLLLLLAQVVSGAVIAAWHFNVLTAMIHSAIVSAYWGALSYLSFQVMPPLGTRRRLEAGQAAAPVPVE